MQSSMNNHPMIIMVSGYARAGKDTMADGIMSHIQMSKKIAMADSLKRAANDAIRTIMARSGAINKWDNMGFFNDTFKTLHRPLLVELGKTCRFIHQDCFIDCMVNDASNLLLNGVSVVSPDVRYSNEYLRIKSMAIDLGFRHRTILVHTHGAQAANDEERKNMEDLLEHAAFNDVSFWHQNQADKIRQHGRNLAEHWFTKPNQD